MERINKIFAIALAIACVVSCVVPATAIIVVSFVLSAFIAFIAMMQVVNYQGYDNPGQFWFIYSAVGGVVLVAIFYGAGFKLINEGLSISLMTGLAPMVLPILGVFIGDLVRILFKGEPSII